MAFPFWFRHLQGYQDSLSIYTIFVIPPISAKLSNNYDEFWYRIRILKFAALLTHKYGADIDIICAIVALRKLGTKFFEFTFEHDTSEDIDTIINILHDANFPQNKAVVVAGYFHELNQRNGRADSIEYKIVNDAFLLASIGAVGLARYFMRNEYSNLGVRDFQQLDSLFKSRYKQLILPQSINVAQREIKFTYLFSALLQQEPTIAIEYSGKYIILEGNSGTGKTTQADYLMTYFKEMGKDVTVVEEPTKYYKDFETFIENATKMELADEKPLFRYYSIIGDRYQQIHEKVIRGLEHGDIVISVRSFISMLVYQCETEMERLFVNYIHHFLPKPDVVILYDATEDVCLQRAIDRGTRFSPFDKLDGLKKYRPLFLDVAKSPYFDFPVEVVDANNTEEEVAEATIKAIAKYL